MAHKGTYGRTARRASSSGRVRSTLRLSKKRFPFGKFSGRAARLGFGFSKMFTHFKRGGL